MVPRIWNISQNGRFKIMSMTEDTLNESLNIMRTSFFIEETVCKICGVYKNHKAIEELVGFAKESTRDGVSTVAVDNIRNVIAGVHVNKFMVKNEESISEKYSKLCKEEESKLYFKFMCESENEFDLFKHYNADCGLEGFILSVLPEYRGHGLAHQFSKVLVDIAGSLAKGDNVKVPTDGKLLNLNSFPKFVVGFGTTPATTKAKADLPFQVLKEVNFAVHFDDSNLLRGFPKTYVIEGMKLPI